MVPHRPRGRTLVMAGVILILAVLAGAGFGWKWFGPHALYVFSPCPGLTVTSTATSGVWNCPNEPALTAGQNVTMTGSWATGYATFTCVPLTSGSPCAVPQIAALTSYLHVNIAGDSWFVVQWKQGATVQLTDGQRVTISGTLHPIAHPSNPGALYLIYHLNNQTGGSDLLQPQPSFEITNAVLG